MAEEPDPRSLLQGLNEDLMKAAMELPAVQAYQAEEREGRGTLPPHQYAELLQKQLEAWLWHLPSIVDEHDRLRWKVYRLEQAVEARAAAEDQPPSAA